MNAPGPDSATAGSAPALDVFALRDSVVGEYKRFATSFTTIHAPDIREQVEGIYARDRYWPEPLIQINPSYKRSTDVGALVASGILEPGCADIFRANGEPLSLYKHQEQAVALAAEGESYVVTTGTGSGKSLCFFIPIVSHVLNARRSSTRRRTHAIVVYPMNALANSQMDELAKFVGQGPGAPPITFDRYTGQDDRGERTRIAREPPDILLTNFMMLELLMTRQEELDRQVIGNCAGASVPRPGRVAHVPRPAGCGRGAARATCPRAAAAREPPVHRHVGNDGERGIAGGQEPRGRGRGFEAVRERDRREQRHHRDARAHHRFDRYRGFGQALARRGRRFRNTTEHPRRGSSGAPRSRCGWRRVSASRSPRSNQRWVRARPMTVSEAVKELSKDSGRSPEDCRRALRDLLLVSSVPERERDLETEPRSLAPTRAASSRSSSPPVHLRRRPRLGDARSAG